MSTPLTSDQLRNAGQFHAGLSQSATMQVADQQDELLDAMETFCKRVEAGEVRSIVTYSRFNALLIKYGRRK